MIIVVGTRNRAGATSPNVSSFLSASTSFLPKDLSFCLLHHQDDAGGTNCKLGGPREFRAAGERRPQGLAVRKQKPRPPAARTQPPRGGASSRARQSSPRGDLLGVPQRSVSDATPAARARPVLCAWTDRGCKVIDLPKPPISAFGADARPSDPGGRGGDADIVARQGAAPGPHLVGARTSQARTPLLVWPMSRPNFLVSCRSSPRCSHGASGRCSAFPSWAGDNEAETRRDAATQRADLHVLLSGRRLRGRDGADEGGDA